MAFRVYLRRCVRWSMSNIYHQSIKPCWNGEEYREFGSLSSHKGKERSRNVSFRLASTIFHHYIASDTASESFAGLKRIHGLMPYFMMKGILKVSNPVAMIRGMSCVLLNIYMMNPYAWAWWKCKVFWICSWRRLLEERAYFRGQSVN